MPKKGSNENNSLGEFIISSIVDTTGDTLFFMVKFADTTKNIICVDDERRRFDRRLTSSI